MKTARILSLSLLVAACSQSNELIPAKLVNADNTVRTEIASVVAQELGQQSVLLSRDLFLDTHLLVLDRSQNLGLQTQDQGRVLEAPARFELFTDNTGECVLRMEGKRQTHALKQANCLPLNP